MKKLRKFTNENIDKKIKNKNLRRTIISAITSFFIFILTVYFLLIMYGKFSQNNNKFQINSFVVISGSMEPTLKINDLIFNIKVKEENIKKGDIISFKEGNNVVTHRINNIVEENGKKYYETKGDNNPNVDEKMTEYDNIVGRYIFKIPKIGYSIRNMQTQIGIFAIIVLLLFAEVHARKKENKEYIRHRKRIEKEADEKGDTK